VNGLLVVRRFNRDESIIKEGPQLLKNSDDQKSRGEGKGESRTEKSREPRRVLKGRGLGGMTKKIKERLTNSGGPGKKDGLTGHSEKEDAAGKSNMGGDCR